MQTKLTRLINHQIKHSNLMLVVSEYSKILSCCLITIRYYFLVSYSIWGKVWGGGGVLSRVQLFATPWTVALQAPLSMEFSRQKYWSGLPFPSPENLPDPGIEPTSPALTDGFFTTEPPGNLYRHIKILIAFQPFSYGIPELLEPI